MFAHIDHLKTAGPIRLITSAAPVDEALAESASQLLDGTEWTAVLVEDGVLQGRPEDLRTLIDD